MFAIQSGAEGNLFVTFIFQTGAEGSPLFPFFVVVEYFLVFLLKFCLLTFIYLKPFRQGVYVQNVILVNLNV